MSQAIPWSKDVPLQWGDFRADPHPAAFEDAFGAIAYRPSWTVHSEEKAGSIQFFVGGMRLVTEFLPDLSWVRQMYATPELLRHQQGHFDLAEMLRPEITEGILGKIGDQRHAARGQNDEERKQYARAYTSSILGREVRQWSSYLDERRSEYDAATEFGQNAEAQSVYDEQFSRLRARLPGRADS